MKSIIAIVAATAAIAFASQASAAMGGNAGAESGAYNISIGKCTMYRQQVKDAEKQGIDPTTIVKPKGC